MRKQKYIPTIKDVAKNAGVSVKTASRVINNFPNVRPQTKKKVLEAAKKLGYRPNALAKSLRIQRSYTIGVIISDIANNFFGTVMKGIENVAISKNYNIIFANSDENIQKEKMYCKLFIEKQVEGIIIIPAPGSQSYLNDYVKDIPIVFVDREPKDFEGPVVKVDNEDGAYKLTKHLVADHGYQKVTFLATDLNINPVSERFQGYKKAVEEYGLELIIKDGNRTVEDGYMATEAMLKNNRPQAIFACNHVMALGAIKAVKKYFLEIPRDIAVVGFDDFESAEVFRPYLTVVSQTPYEMGKYAAEILFKQIENDSKDNRKIIMPVELKNRESCGCLIFER